MSKKAIDFTQIDKKALTQLEKFSVARIAIAKEEQRHKSIINLLKKKLEAIHESRENDIKAGIPLDDILVKFPTIEVDKAIRAENILHKEIMKPLNFELKSTYGFIPDGLYDGYVIKIENQRRGEYLKYIQRFLEDMGIIEISQSALCKLAEQISDRIGVTVSKTKTLLEDGVFSCVLNRKQFNKLFMSVFCDILVLNEVMTINI